MISCSWKEHLGVECPGCGAQRSFLQLIHGDLYRAIELFPAIIPLAIAFTAFLLLLLPAGKKTKQFSAALLPFSFLFAASMMLQTWFFRFWSINGSQAVIFGGFFYLLILFVGIKITFTDKLKLR